MTTAVRIAASLLLLCLARKCAAFLVTTSSGASHRRVSAPTELFVSTSATQGAVSDDLLRAVLSKSQDPQTVQSLVRDLVESPDTNKYDPNVCLFGPLYCTLAAFTPNEPNRKPPLWERVSLKTDNLKGQQYTADDVGDDSSAAPVTGSVINYSEIWGPAMHLRATGTFVPAKDDEESSSEDSKSSKPQPLFGFLKPPTPTVSSNERTCPDDFTVFINGASITVGGLQLQLPIEGSSTLRVLYADPKLRIFVSPQASDSLAGEWENAGLVVVQVRSDLVANKAIDLR